RIEANELTVEAGLVLGPDRPEREHALLQQLPPGAKGGPVVLHLLGVPARTDPEEHATGRGLVEGWHLLRRDDRIALDQQADARGHLDARGHRRRGGERHEEVVGVGVLLRQHRAARPRAAARGRNVGVLGKPHRLETARFGLARQHVGTDRVVGREHLDAEEHGVPATPVVAAGQGDGALRPCAAAGISSHSAQARSGLRYTVTTAAPPSPRLCWRATLASFTWRFSARPRSCQLSSAHWARPVAPRGWPFEMRPPDGFTTHFPPYVTAPESISSPPLPGSHRPRPS